MKSINISTKTLVCVALLTALAYAISFIEIPIFPAAPFLKLDVGNVFVLLSGFMFGPVFGVVSLIVKEALRFFSSSTGGVGEVANIIMALSFIVVPTISYRFKKGFKWVLVYLVIGTLLQAGTSLLVNRYINFPLFVGAKAEEFFGNLWHFVLLFNLIKGVVVSVITIILYKRVRFLFDKVESTIIKRKTYDFTQKEYISKSELDTKNFAKNFATYLKPNSMLILEGDLGAGKTAFVKGLAKGLNIDDDVVSPTYAYLNVYGNYLYHYDFYRLSCGEDAERLGLSDYFEKDNICVFEWAERVSDIIDEKKCIKISIEKLTNTKRKIVIENELFID